MDGFVPYTRKVKKRGRDGSDDLIRSAIHIFFSPAKTIPQERKSNSQRSIEALPPSSRPTLKHTLLNTKPSRIHHSAHSPQYSRAAQDDPKALHALRR